MSLTESREAEQKLKDEFSLVGIRTAAVNIGGEYITSIKKIIERAVVAAKREGVITDSHYDEGAIAGLRVRLYRKLCPKHWV